MAPSTLPSTLENSRHDDEQHMRNGQSKSYRCPILLGFPPWLCSSTSLKRIIRCTIFARRGLPGCRVLASHGQACPCTHIQFYAFDVLVHRDRNVLRSPPEQRRACSSSAGQGKVPPICSLHSLRRNPPLSSVPQGSWSLRASSPSIQGPYMSRANATARGSNKSSLRRRGL